MVHLKYILIALFIGTFADRILSIPFPEIQADDDTTTTSTTLCDIACTQPICTPNQTLATPICLCCCPICVDNY